VVKFAFSAKEAVLNKIAKKSKDRIRVIGVKQEKRGKGGFHSPDSYTVLIAAEM
jgi:hypothetical protein